MHTIAAFEKNVITFCLGPSIKKKNSVALVTHLSKEMLLDYGVLVEIIHI